MLEQPKQAVAGNHFTFSDGIVLCQMSNLFATPYILILIITAAKILLMLE
jgi:hypothetical protein